MPYYKKRFRARRRRRLVRRRRYRRGGLARQLNAVGLAPELKFFQKTESALTVLDTGDVSSITGISQGDGVNTRDGNNIRIKSIYGKYMIELGTTAAQIIRHMWIIDKSPDGTDPTIAEIFQDSTLRDAIVSGLNIANTGRFRVLLDKIYKVVPDGSNEIAYRRHYKKVNIPIKYAGSGTSSETNQKIYEVFISRSQADGPVVHSDLRIRFYG